MSFQNDTVRISFLRDDLIRLEYSASGEFLNAPTYFAVNRFESIPVLIKEAGDSFVIESEKIQVRYQNDGKALSAENLVIQAKDGQWEWSPGKENKANLGGPIESLDGVRGPVALSEGLLARDGWHLIDDSRGHVLANQWIRPPVDEPSRQDWYFFGYGSDYKAGLAALGSISGKVPLPRRYALGSWYSRYWPYRSDELLNIVDEYKEKKFPLDIMVLDMDWHHNFGKDHWTGYTWDRSLIPEPSDLIKGLHDDGVAVCLNDHPAEGVPPGEESYPAFMRSMNASSDDGLTLPFDAGDEFYMHNFWSATHSPHEAIGVDFWWLDWQQRPFTLSLPQLKNVTWLNHYYYQRSQDQGLRGLSFSRWGGWGDHRHPIHFSGDTATTWSALNFEIGFNATSANAGLFYWSHDIGGHLGHRDGEMVARWVQFGATSPALRLHSGRDASLDRRPWSYRADFSEAMRQAFLLRTQLFPYIYSSAYQAFDKMLPLNRPMYLEHPRDEEAYQSLDQYYLGDHLIVAPISKAGAGAQFVATRKVWLPESEGGELWYDWFTHASYAPGSHIVGSPLSEFPLFVRGGILIPLQESHKDHIANGSFETLRLLAFPGLDNKEGHSFLYEDDGQSKEYESGKYAVTDYSYKRFGNSVAIHIKGAKGDYAGLPRHRQYSIELPDTLPIESIRPQVAHSYNPETKTNYITLEKVSVFEPIALGITFSDSIPPNTPNEGKKRLLSVLDPRLGQVETLEQLAAFEHELEPEILKEALAILGVYIDYQSDGKLTISHNQASIATRVLAKANDSEQVQGYPLCEVSRCEYMLPKVRHASQWVGIDMEQILDLTLNRQGAKLNFKLKIDQVTSTIDQWQVSEAYPFTKEAPLQTQKFAPELGGESRWQNYPSDEKDGSLDIRKIHDHDFHLTYMRTMLTLDQSMDVEFIIHSDDGVELLIDDHIHHINDVARSMDEKPDLVKVHLESGQHSLLVKVSNHWGGWGLKVGVKAERMILSSPVQ